jgi:hypothetical protein
VRVLTFNALSPTYVDRSKRRDVVVAWLRRLRPDIVALQEVVADRRSVRWRERASATTTPGRAAHPDEPGHTFAPRNRLVRDGGMYLARSRRIGYIMVRGPGHCPTLEVLSCDLAFSEPVDGVQARKSRSQGSLRVSSIQ